MWFVNSYSTYCCFPTECWLAYQRQAAILPETVILYKLMGFDTIVIFAFEKIKIIYQCSLLIWQHLVKFTINGKARTFSLFLLRKITFLHKVILFFDDELYLEPFNNVFIATNDHEVKPSYIYKLLIDQFL